MTVTEQQENVRQVPIAPWERYALVMKTGAGKTTTGTCLACRLVPATKKEAKGWEVWWIDSKGDPKDLLRLYKWGFRRGDGPRRLFTVRYNGKGLDIHQQVEKICEAALKRHGVLVVVDEYVHVVKNQTMAGVQLLNVFQRGRGLDVGIIGHTQEPVFIPRQLISQAAHILLGDLSYPRDIERANEYFPGYERPPNKYGFWHGAIDFDGNWAYWSNVQEWLNAFSVESV